MEDRALHAEGDQRKMDFVQVLVEEHGNLQQGTRRAPGYVHATVALQAEQRAQAFLPAARRAQLDQKVRDRGPDVHQTVRCSRRDLEHVSGAERPPPTPDAEAELAGDTLEALPLARVHVRRNEAPGPDEELGRHAIGRPLAEDDRLARDRVGDSVYAGPDQSI
jgi:hypothetical protein